MNKAKTIFFALCLCWLIAIPVPITAQTAGYTKHDVKGRVQLEIPSDWAVSDAEQRKRVRERAGELDGSLSHHTASLAAQSYLTRSQTMVRVSFVPIEPPLTQADVRQAVQANKQQILKELADFWRDGSPVMWTSLAKLGKMEVGLPRFAVKPIGGRTALITSYASASIDNPAETTRVTQYHVPMGAEKALITLSYREGDQQAISVSNRLKNSIVIR